MSETTIIPPVEAGETESELSFEYRKRGRSRQWRATGEHCWRFDHSAYHDLTGLHIGSDYPYVPQTNGHTLRVHREFNLTDPVFDGVEKTDGQSASIFIEEKGVRGTYSWDYFWSLEGHYSFEYKDHLGNDGAWMVTRTDVEERHTTDGELLPILDGNWYSDLRDFVRRYHNGHVAVVPHPDELFERLIEEDSPEDAIPVEEYKHEEPEPAIAD